MINVRYNPGRPFTLNMLSLFSVINCSTNLQSKGCLTNRSNSSKAHSATSIFLQMSRQPCAYFTSAIRRPTVVPPEANLTILWALAAVRNHSHEPIKLDISLSRHSGGRFIGRSAVDRRSAGRPNKHDHQQFDSTRQAARFIS